VPTRVIRQRCAGLGLTILIFVRCLDGCILAADRKATTTAGISQEEAKCNVFKGGWAIAGSGNDGSAIRSLFNRVNDEHMTIENVESIIIDELTKYAQISEVNIQCIVLVARNKMIKASLVETTKYGAFPSPVTSPFLCIGETTPKIIAQHYLKKRDYANQCCEDAAPEILAILGQACEEGTFVGEQAKFGLDIVLFKNGEFCLKTRVTIKWADLDIEFHRIEGINFQFERFAGEML
jgi:20S proteasome alpha/beta subunit